MRNILGISAFYHDSAAALVIGGKIIAAAQEERFTRVKNTAAFPVHAIRYCLDHAGLQVDDLDAIVFYDKPILKFERLLETYYAFAPKGIHSFLASMPVWLDEKLFLKKNIYKQLKHIGPYKKDKLKLLFSEHHLSHAASAFYPSPFPSAAILTVDGVGEWGTASIGTGTGNTIKILKEMPFPHSVGLLYSSFTYFLGFKVNSGEYKLMGLAPFGNTADAQTDHFKRLITTHLVHINNDGSIALNQDYFTYATGLRMINNTKWETLFGIPKRDGETDFSPAHCNLALAIQEVTEDIMLRMAAEARKLTGADYLCLAGGVALNCVANGKLLRSGLFKDIYIQPAAGDAGGAIGAALAASRMYFGDQEPASKTDAMAGAYLGPAYTDKDIETMCKASGAAYHRYPTFDETAAFVASQLAEGKITGWFQGRMEFGPRALGNRSILAYPGSTDMQEKVNAHIKFREGFRPFAPSVLEEDMPGYFGLQGESPYMLLVAPLKDAYRKPVPAAYASMHLRDKLKTPRSEFQAITHVDFSARVQGVKKAFNEKFHSLLELVKRETGHGILLNTSFNVRGEPVVNTPEDAFRCFMNTKMDMLVMNQYVFLKHEQPADVKIPPAKVYAEPAEKHQPERSVSTIAIALVILYFITGREWLFNLGLLMGLIAVFSGFLSRKIEYVWMKLAQVLGLFMPKIILSFMFYIVLFPVALLSRVFSRKDPLLIRRHYVSTFQDRNKIFTPESFKKLW